MSDQGPVVLSGRYELHRRIARGGMAEVYLARDQLLERPVAVKILVPEFATDRNFVERFRREAQAAANLNHPNIVGVYDWGKEAGTHFIVMEYVDGRSLADILRTEGTLHPDRAADIATDVAAALGFAHRNGVVHRDVKPGNVLISTHGVVKVTDFGIARAISSGAEENLTQTGSVMGTATYFSPEQAQGKPVDPRSDLYSLGVVMYEMVCGKPPFQGDSPVAIAYKHVQEQPPPLRHLNVDIPPSYEAITQKLLAKNPANRYPSAEDLRADLRRFRQGQPVLAEGVLDPPVPATIATPRAAATQAIAGTTTITRAGSGTGTATALPEYDEPPPRRRTGWFIFATIVLLAALGVGLYFLARSLGVGGGSKVEVPDVHNLSRLDAQKRLSDQGFSVDSNSILRYSTKVPYNDVIGTRPAAHSRVDKNSGIKLIVSAGPPVKIPDHVTDLSGNALALELEHQNPNVRIKKPFVVETSNEVDYGKVIRTDPGAGQELPPGDQVTIVVSGGAKSQVPSVTGFDVGQATTALNNAGYTVGTTSQEYSTSIGQGAVISTDPAGGTHLKPGSTVNLVVSLGPPPTTTTTTTTAPSTTSSSSTTTSSTTSSTTPTTKPGPPGPGGG